MDLKGIYGYIDYENITKLLKEVEKRERGYSDRGWGDEFFLYCLCGKRGSNYLVRIDQFGYYLNTNNKNKYFDPYFNFERGKYMEARCEYCHRHLFEMGELTLIGNVYLLSGTEGIKNCLDEIGFKRV